MRKYNEFKIEVEFLNGDIEEINYKSYDTKSYKQMMELYKETRDTYRDTSCKIKFKGISEEGELGVLFIKEIKTKDQELKEEAEYIESVSIEVLLENILKLGNIINEEKKRLINLKISEIDKKISSINHHAGNKKYATAEEKIIAMDELSNLNEKRRCYKDERSFFNSFHNQKKYKFIREDEIKEAIEWLKVQQLRKQIKIENDDYEKKYKVEKVKYKNEKERLKIMRRIEGKYDNINIDRKNMEIIYYNNVIKK